MFNKLILYNFRAFRGYHELNLETVPGILAVLGPNGSGKSTILTMIGILSGELDGSLLNEPGSYIEALFKDGMRFKVANGPQYFFAGSRCDKESYKESCAPWLNSVTLTSVDDQKDLISDPQKLLDYLLTQFDIDVSSLPTPLTHSDLSSSSSAFSGSSISSTPFVPTVNAGKAKSSTPNQDHQLLSKRIAKVREELDKKILELKKARAHNRQVHANRESRLSFRKTEVDKLKLFLERILLQQKVLNNLRSEFESALGKFEDRCSDLASQKSRFLSNITTQNTKLVDLNAELMNNEMQSQENNDKLLKLRAESYVSAAKTHVHARENKKLAKTMAKIRNQQIWFARSALSIFSGGSPKPMPQMDASVVNSKSSEVATSTVAMSTNQEVQSMMKHILVGVKFGAREKFMLDNPDLIRYLRLLAPFALNMRELLGGIESKVAGIERIIDDVQLNIKEFRQHQDRLTSDLLDIADKLAYCRRSVTHGTNSGHLDGLSEFCLDSFIARPIPPQVIGTLSTFVVVPSGPISRHWPIERGALVKLVNSAISAKNRHTAKQLPIDLGPNRYRDLVFVVENEDSVSECIKCFPGAKFIPYFVKDTTCRGWNPRSKLASELLAKYPQVKILSEFIPAETMETQRILNYVLDDFLVADSPEVAREISSHPEWFPQDMAICDNLGEIYPAATRAVVTMSFGSESPMPVCDVYSEYSSKILSLKEERLDTRRKYDDLEYRIASFTAMVTAYTNSRQRWEKMSEICRSSLDLVEMHEFKLTAWCTSLKQNRESLRSIFDEFTTPIKGNISFYISSMKESVQIYLKRKENDDDDMVFIKEEDTSSQLPSSGSLSPDNSSGLVEKFKSEETFRAELESAEEYIDDQIIRAKVDLVNAKNTVRTLDQEVKHLSSEICSFEVQLLFIDRDLELLRRESGELSTSEVNITDVESDIADMAFHSDFSDNLVMSYVAFEIETAKRKLLSGRQPEDLPSQGNFFHHEWDTELPVDVLREEKRKLRATLKSLETKMGHWRQQKETAARTIAAKLAPHLTAVYREVYRGSSDMQSQIYLTPISNAEIDQGLLFRAIPAGKPYGALDSLSAGEFAMAHFALKMAIALVQQKTLVLLDEFDSPLDSMTCRAFRLAIDKYQSQHKHLAFVLTSHRRLLFDAAQQFIFIYRPHNIPKVVVYCYDDDPRTRLETLAESLLLTQN